MKLIIPGEFYEANVALDAIYRHPELQVRALARFGDQQVRRDIVQDYRQLYAEDKDLGRLTLVEEVDEQEHLTGRMLLADGNHRFEALLLLGRETAPCRIYHGDMFTAILLAARENGGRGLQFSLNDRKKVAEQMLIGLTKRNSAWSNAEIAEWAGFDRSTVRGVREDLKYRRGLAIPEDIEVHRVDGRYDPAKGYLRDPIFDEMPNADLYVPPPPPRQAPRRARRAKAQDGAITAESIRQLPRATREQLLLDLGILQVVRQLPSDVLAALLRDLEL